MKVVLGVDFFFRAVLYVILNMSLAECLGGYGWLTIGKFTDFSVEWY